MFFRHPFRTQIGAVVAALLLFGGLCRALVFQYLDGMPLVGPSTGGTRVTIPVLSCSTEAECDKFQCYFGEGVTGSPGKLLVNGGGSKSLECISAIQDEGFSGTMALKVAVVSEGANSEIFSIGFFEYFESTFRGDSRMDVLEPRPNEQVLDISVFRDLVMVASSVVLGSTINRYVDLYRGDCVNGFNLIPDSVDLTGGPAGNGEAVGIPPMTRISLFDSILALAERSFGSGASISLQVWILKADAHGVFRVVSQLSIPQSTSWSSASCLAVGSKSILLGARAPTSGTGRLISFLADNRDPLVSRYYATDALDCELDSTSPDCYYPVAVAVGEPDKQALVLSEASRNRRMDIVYLSSSMELAAEGEVVVDVPDDIAGIALLSGRVFVTARSVRGRKWDVFALENDPGLPARLVGSITPDSIGIEGYVGDSLTSWVSPDAWAPHVILAGSFPASVTAVPFGVAGTITSEPRGGMRSQIETRIELHVAVSSAAVCSPECRFGSLTVKGTVEEVFADKVALSCRAPVVAQPGLVDLFASLNGQDFHYIDRFQYLSPASFDFSPAAGPLAGTMVNVEAVGDALYTESRCRFGYILVPVSREGEDTFCLAPSSLEPGMVSLAIARDGVSFEPAGFFYYYDFGKEVTVSPLCVPSHGGTPVEIIVPAMRASQHVGCAVKVRSLSDVAQMVPCVMELDGNGGGLATYTSPQLSEEGPLTLELSFNGQDFEELFTEQGKGLGLAAYALSERLIIFPESGELSGSETVRISLDAYDSYEKSCDMQPLVYFGDSPTKGDTNLIAALMKVEATTPAVQVCGTVPVRLSLSGREDDLERVGEFSFYGDLDTDSSSVYFEPGDGAYNIGYAFKVIVQARDECGIVFPKDFLQNVAGAIACDWGANGQPFPLLYDLYGQYSSDYVSVASAGNCSVSVYDIAGRVINGSAQEIAVMDYPMVTSSSSSSPDRAQLMKNTTLVIEGTSLSSPSVRPLVSFCCSSNGCHDGEVVAYSPSRLEVAAPPMELCLGVSNGLYGVKISAMGIPPLKPTDGRVNVGDFRIITVTPRVLYGGRQSFVHITGIFDYSKDLMTCRVGEVDCLHIAPFDYFRYVVCELPKVDVGVYPVECTVDGQNYVTAPETLRIFGDPVFVSVSPQVVLSGVSMELEVLGHGFPITDTAGCTFFADGENTTLATYLSESVVRCPLPDVDPATLPRTLQLLVTFDAEAMHETRHNIEIFPSLEFGSPEPAFGMSVGGTVVRLPVFNSPQHSDRSDVQVLVGSRIGKVLDYEAIAGSVVFSVPAAADAEEPAEAAISISFNGGDQWSSTGQVFSYLGSARLSEPFPVFFSLGLPFSVTFNLSSGAVPQQVGAGFSCDVCGAVAESEYVEATNQLVCKDVVLDFAIKCVAQLSLDGYTFESVQTSIFVGEAPQVAELAPAIVCSDQATVRASFAEPLPGLPGDCLCGLEGAALRECDQLDLWGLVCSFEDSTVTGDAVVQFSFNSDQVYTCGHIILSDNLGVEYLSPTKAPYTGGSLLIWRFEEEAHLQVSTALLSPICVFNGSVVVEASTGEDGFVCVVPPANEAGTVDLSVSVDGCLFSAEVAFEYFSSLEILDVDPGVMPTGTSSTLVLEVKSGFDFAEDGATCRFNGSIAVPLVPISDTKAECELEMEVSGELSVEISLDGISYLQEASAQARVWVYDYPEFVSLSPASVHTSGGVLVVIGGSGLNEVKQAKNPVCVFGFPEGPVSVAASVNSDSVTCLAPEHGALFGPVDVDVNLDGYHFMKSGFGLVYSSTVLLYSVDPPYVPDIGGVSVELRGSGLTEETPFTVCNSVGVCEQMSYVSVRSSTEASAVVPPYPGGLLLSAGASARSEIRCDGGSGVPLDYFGKLESAVDISPHFIFAGRESVLTVFNREDVFPPADSADLSVSSSLFALHSLSPSLLQGSVTLAQTGNFAIVLHFSQYMPEHLGSEVLLSVIEEPSIVGITPGLLDLEEGTVLAIQMSSDVPEEAEIKCLICGLVAEVSSRTPAEVSVLSPQLETGVSECAVELTLVAGSPPVGPPISLPVVGRSAPVRAMPEVCSANGGTAVFVEVASLSTHVQQSWLRLILGDVILDDVALEEVDGRQRISFVCPSAKPGTVAELGVSVDGGAHFQTGLPRVELVYSPQITFVSVSPAVSPVIGGFFYYLQVLDVESVVGKKGARCIAGSGSESGAAEIVDASTITCHLPVDPGRSAGMYSIRFAADGQDFADTGLDLVTFQPPTIESITPARSNTYGGGSHVVKLTGSGDGDDVTELRGQLVGAGEFVGSSEREHFALVKISNTLFSFAMNEYEAGEYALVLSVNMQDYVVDPASSSAFVIIDGSSPSCRLPFYEEIPITKASRLLSGRQFMSNILAGRSDIAVSVEGSLGPSPASSAELFDGDFCCKPARGNFGINCGFLMQVSSDVQTDLILTLPKAAYVTGMTIAFADPCESVPGPAYTVFGSVDQSSDKATLASHQTLGGLRPCPSISSDNGQVALCADYFEAFLGSVFGFSVDPLHRIAGSGEVWVYEVALHGSFVGEPFALEGQFDSSTECVSSDNEVFLHPATVKVVDFSGVEPQDSALSTSVTVSCFLFDTASSEWRAVPWSKDTIAEIVVGNEFVLDELKLETPLSGLYILRVQSAGLVGLDLEFSMCPGPAQAISVSDYPSNVLLESNWTVVVPPCSLSLNDLSGNVAQVGTAVYANCSSGLLRFGSEEGPSILLATEVQQSVSDLLVLEPSVGCHEIVLWGPELSNTVVLPYCVTHGELSRLVLQADLFGLVSGVEVAIPACTVCLTDAGRNTVAVPDKFWVGLRVAVVSAFGGLVLAEKHLIVDNFDELTSCADIVPPTLALAQAQEMELHVGGGGLRSTVFGFSIAPGPPVGISLSVPRTEEAVVASMITSIPSVLVCLLDTAGNTFPAADASLIHGTCLNNSKQVEEGVLVDSGCVLFNSITAAQPSAGRYVYEFSTPGLSPEEIEFHILPGEPANLRESGSQRKKEISSVEQAEIGLIQLELVDIIGNVVSSPKHNVQVDAQIFDPSGALVLTEVSDSIAGIVDFEGLVLQSPVVGRYTLLFSSPGLGEQLSLDLDVRPGPAHRILVHTGQGQVLSEVLTRVPIRKLCLVDAGGNTVSHSSVTADVKVVSFPDGYRHPSVLNGSDVVRSLAISECLKPESMKFFLRVPVSGAYVVQFAAAFLQIDPGIAAFEVLPGPAVALDIDTRGGTARVVCESESVLPDVVVRAVDAGGSFTSIHDAVPLEVEVDYVGGKKYYDKDAGFLLKAGTEEAVLSHLSIPFPEKGAVTVTVFSEDLPSGGAVVFDIVSGQLFRIEAEMIGDDQTAIPAGDVVLLPPVRVRAFDMCGNICGLYSGTNCVFAYADANVEVFGTTSVCSIEGEFLFDDLWVGRPDLGVLSLMFDVDSAEEQSLDVSVLPSAVGMASLLEFSLPQLQLFFAPGPADGLLFDKAPLSAHSNGLLKVAPRLKLIDGLGNRIESYGGTLTFKASTVPPSSVFGDVAFFSNADGVVEFFGFGFNGARNGSYVVRFRSVEFEHISIDSDPIWIEPCPPGSTVSSSDDTVCLCEAGRYLSAIEGECLACPLDSYKASDGNSESCTTCPPSTDSSGLVARDTILACRCAEGYYLPPERLANLNESSVFVCDECPSGAVCQGNNTLAAAEGNWISEENPSVVLPCPQEKSCPGGGAGRCAEGYMGPLCVQCRDGFGKTSEGTCTRCKPRRESLISFALGVALTTFLLRIFMFSAELGKRFKAAFNIRMTMRMKGIIVGYLQIIALVAGVSMPKSARQILGFISDLNSGFGFGPLECSFDLDSYQIYFARFGLPVLYMALALILNFVLNMLHLVVTCCGVRKSKSDKARQRPLLKRGGSSAMELLMGKVSEGPEVSRAQFLLFSLLVSFLYFHPTLASSSFRVLRCTEVDGKSVNLYFDGDACDTDAYGTYRKVAMWAAGFLCLGFPALVLIWMKVAVRYAHSALIVFTSGYKMQFYFWEIIVLMRKIGIAAALVFLSSRPNVQVYVLFWLVWAAFLFQYVLKPQISRVLLNAENIALVSAFTLIAAMLVLRFDVSGGELLTDVMGASIPVVSLSVLFILILLALFESSVRDMFSFVWNSMAFFGFESFVKKPKSAIAMSTMVGAARWKRKAGLPPSRLAAATPARKLVLPSKDLGIRAVPLAEDVASSLPVPHPPAKLEPLVHTGGRIFERVPLAPAVAASRTAPLPVSGVAATSALPVTAAPKQQDLASANWSLLAKLSGGGMSPARPALLPQRLPSSLDLLPSDDESDSDDSDFDSGDDFDLDGGGFSDDDDF